jgi:putative transposase
VRGRAGNGYCESFNSKLRDELLNGELFYSLAEARIIIEGWRQLYNTRPPALTALIWPAAQAKPASPAASPVAAKPTMH